MKKVLGISSVLLGVVFLAGCGQQPVSQTQQTTPAPATQTPITNQPVATQPASTDPTLATYTNAKYGFEFQYPKIWKTQSREIGSGWGEKDYIWFDSDFSVSISDTSMYSFNQLKEAPPGIDPASVKEKNITLNGSPASEVTYTQVGDAGSESEQMKKIAVLKNNLVYMIECAVTDCEKVIPTFKFTK
ncbi:MAG: PsbP-related protein [bacterium]